MKSHNAKSAGFVGRQQNRVKSKNITIGEFDKADFGFLNPKNPSTKIRPNLSFSKQAKPKIKKVFDIF
jgi:hypothetical protein